MRNGKRNGVGHNSGILRIRRTYNIVNQDPMAKILADAIESEIGLGKGVANKLHLLTGGKAGGVGGSTVSNLLGGKTRRPQHATMASLGEAIGWKFKLVKEDKINFDTELIRAKRWINRHLSEK